MSNEVSKQQKQISLSEGVGKFISYWRKDRLKLSQGALARRAAEKYGLPWIQPTVAQIEAGKRNLTMEEFSLLTAILDISDHRAIFEWLGHKDRDFVIALTERYSAKALSLTTLFGGGQPHLERVASASLLTARTKLKFQLEDDASQDAERKAAVKLHCKPIEIAKAARKRWGHSLTEERDRQLKEVRQTTTEPKRLQRVRGWITRDLVKELAADISKTNRK